jgi:hypothetical protein
MLVERVLANVCPSGGVPPEKRVVKPWRAELEVTWQRR